MNTEVFGELLKQIDKDKREIFVLARMNLGKGSSTRERLYILHLTDKREILHKDDQGRICVKLQKAASGNKRIESIPVEELVSVMPFELT